MKKDVMKDFIMTRFYELPEDVDVMEAYEQFEKEQMQEDMESFAYETHVDVDIISDAFSEYAFSGTLSDEDIRKRLSKYQMGLLQMTGLTKSVKSFIVDTYRKYKAEGEEG